LRISLQGDVWKLCVLRCRCGKGLWVRNSIVMGIESVGHIHGRHENWKQASFEEQSEDCSARYLVILNVVVWTCRARLPAVTYLRLDGSVPAASRHSIVNKCVSSCVKIYSICSIW